MTVRGKWRITEMSDFDEDYVGTMGPAYILFDDSGSGEFAFGCVTGAIHGAGNGKAVDFSWDGNDEMDEVCGHGSAHLQPDGTLQGEIAFLNGDEFSFIAIPWKTSSTAC